MLILHQIVCQKLRLILLRASQMTNDYGEEPWAPAEIFVGGGRGKSEKGPHMVKKAPPPINVAEKDSTWRKSNKNDPQIASKCFFNFPVGGGGDRLLLPPPCRRPWGGELLLFPHVSSSLLLFSLIGGGFFVLMGVVPGFFLGCPLIYKIFLTSPTIVL